MLFETVIAMVEAGRNALSALRPGQPCEVSVSLLDLGQLSFPSLAVLRISGHNLGFVHVGADGDLRHFLLSVPDADGRLAGAQVLADDVLSRLAEALPGRFARGRVEHLALAPVSLGTRGVRTFGVRCRSDIGQLFLMAEVPSLAEVERERGRNTLNALSNGCLPPGWMSAEDLGDEAADGLTDYLLSSETDVHMLLPTADGAETEKAAVLVAALADDDGMHLTFAVPVDADMWGRIEPGRILRARAGVEDRSLEFKLACHGIAPYTVAPGIRLPCVHCAAPTDIQVVQSRRSFRINLLENVDAQIATSDPGVAIVSAQLADLSFSGARLIYSRANAEGVHAPDDRIQCRLHLPDGEEPVDVIGRVRRVGRNLDELARPRVEIGVEFESTGSSGGAMGRVRQFVLHQQRARLARRVQVAGVGDW